MKTKAALYARVSTNDQTKGTSLGEQLTKAREYALNQGYEIVAEDQDVISGAFILARSTFNHYLERIANSEINVIVVDIPDRLGRGDTIAKCELLAQLHGGRIEYAAPGRDDSTIEGIALKATDMLVSGLERINTRRRTMSGKKAWAEKGRVIASPYRPYGLRFHKKYDEHTGRKTDCTLVVVPHEAVIVMRMFEACVYHHRSPYSIALELTAEAIPTMADTEGVKRKKTQTKCEWHKDTVQGILTNPVYKGEWQYGKNAVTRIDTPDGVKTKIRKRDEADVIKISVPAIVSVELWEAAQEELRDRAKRHTRETRFVYLLRGRIRCAKCGGQMAGSTRYYEGKKKTTISWRYRCIKKYQFGRNSPVACDVRNIDGQLTEALVWDALVILMLDEDKLFGQIAAQRQAATAAQAVIEQTIMALEAQNQAEIAGLERLLDLYTLGELDKERYLAKKHEIEGRKATRSQEMIEWRQRLAGHLPLDQEAEQNLRQLRQAISLRLGQATFEQKRQLMAALRLECVYDDDTGQLLVSGIFGNQTLSLWGDGNEGSGNEGGTGGETNKGEDTSTAEKFEYEERKHVHVAGGFEHRDEV